MKTMTRREAREQAFMLMFEKSFHDDRSVADIIDGASADRDIVVDEFAQKLCYRVVREQETIDKRIEENLRNWKMERLSRVALAILRMSACEILYMKDIPVSVSINEAVEIAKKYATPEDAGFINGLLGSIADAEAAKAKEEKKEDKE